MWKTLYVPICYIRPVLFIEKLLLRKWKPYIWDSTQFSSNMGMFSIIHLEKQNIILTIHQIDKPYSVLFLNYYGDHLE